MSELPQISGAELVRALQKVGFTVRRWHGSLIILRQADITPEELVGLQ